MRDKVTLLARVREIRNGKLSFVFERVETHKKGKPIQPKEPENATAYYLRYTEGGKRVTQPTGQNFSEAVTACRNKEVAREYIKRGLDLPPTHGNDSRRTIADAVQDFIQKNRTLDKAPATRYGYERAVTQFRDSCGKVFLDELNEKTMLDHIDWIRDNVPTRSHGQRNGTVRTRLQFLTAFFISEGMKNPLPMKQWPKTIEQEVRAFTSEEIALLLSKANTDESDLIQFLLYTGFRDNEAANTFYSDVDFKNSSVNIAPKRGIITFKTKNGKSREYDIKLPADFVQRLRDRRERNGVKNDDTLIFPNSNGGVDSCLLARVRNAANRAGYTEHFGLHKFRKTFGTRYADKHGVRTAQKLLGHSNVKTTEKYLAVTTISNGQADSLFADVVGK